MSVGPVHERSEVKWSYQGLAAKESNYSGHGHQVPDAVVDRLVLDGGSDPYVAGKPFREEIGVPFNEFGSPRRTLCQHLIHMSVDRQHHPEALTDKVIRDVTVEQIRHGVNEDPPRIPPPPGHSEPLRPDPHREGIAPIHRSVYDRKP